MVIEVAPLLGSVFGAFNWPAAVAVGVAAAIVVAVVAVPLLVVGAVTAVGAACIAVGVGVVAGAGAGFYFNAPDGGESLSGTAGSPAVATTEQTPTPPIPVTKVEISFVPKDGKSNEAAEFRCRIDVHRQNASASDVHLLQRETHRVEEGTAESFYAKCDVLLDTALRNVGSPDGVVVTIYVQPSPGVPAISRLKDLIKKHAGEPDVVHRSLPEGAE